MAALSATILFKSVNQQYDRLMTQFEKNAQYKMSVDTLRAKAPDIKSVDDLLKNRRALEIALSAFQLEDQINSTGLLRQLLTQDPADAKSLANRLRDPRYLNFAKAFADLKNNTPSLKATNIRDSMTSTYQNLQARQQEGTKSQMQSLSFYFRLFAGSVNSVDGFLSDSKLVTVALKSYGIGDLNDELRLRQLLTEDPADPKSFAFSSGDPRYLAFAKGMAGLNQGQAIWSNPGNLEQSLINYADAVQSDLADQAKTAKANAQHFTDAAAKLTSPDALLKDTTSLKLVLTSFGLDSKITDPAFLEQLGVDTGRSKDFDDFLQTILTQDPNNSDSLVNRLTDSRYLNFAKALADPELGLGILQSPDFQNQITTAYQSRTQASIDLQSSGVQTALDDFAQLAPDISNAADLMKNPRLLAVAMGARNIFDLNDSSKIRQLLTQDPNDPTSFAQTSGDTRFLAFALDMQGLQSSQKIWSDPAALAQTATAFSNATAHLLATQQQDATDKIQHFRDNVASLTTVKAFLADKESRDLVLSAYRMSGTIDSSSWQPKISDKIYSDPKVTDFLRKLLTEDPADAKATVAKPDYAGFKTFAGAMQGLNKGFSIFSKSKKLEDLITAYKTNEFEKSQGEQDPAVREALYFKRNITGVTSVYQIITNKPLYKVVRVALGLPDQLGALAADQQKRQIDGRLDVKKLSDPAYVDKLIQRFLANSDAQAAQASGGDPVIALLTGQSSDTGGGAGAINLLA